MSSYFLLLHPKWTALHSSWNIHTPGMHGPPLETIGPRKNLSHRQGCFHLKKTYSFQLLSHFTESERVLKWIIFTEIHNLQAKSPLYKMWNVLSNSCEHFKRALLFGNSIVAKGNWVGFKIFLGLNSAFTLNQKLSKQVLHGWGTELFMKTGMGNWDVEM